jgi:hypothetical protein
MSDFKLEKQLPSCDVDKKLLKGIEDYLLARAKALAGKDILEDNDRFSVEIHDDLGVETVRSVDDIPEGQFLDSTKQIKLHLNLKYGLKRFPLEIDVKFDKDRIFSNLNIYYSGDDARSAVAGLHDGIMRLVMSAKNNNRYFNPPAFLEGVLWVSASVPMFVGSILEKHLANAQSYGYLIMALMWAYLIAGKRLRPYTAFDTPVTKRNAKLVEFFIYGLLGFVLFGTVLTDLRKSTLGF